MTEAQKVQRPLGFKVVAIVNGIGALYHLLYWLVMLPRLSSLYEQNVIPEHYSIVTLSGFGIADLIWFIPLLSVGSIGLWRMRPIGWLAAILSNVIYWYSLTIILVIDLSARSISPVTVTFLPLMAISFWAAYYLWVNRAIVLNTGGELNIA